MTTPQQPLRILVVVNLAWDPRLGATRVWMELAEQWRAAGHTVDKFCLSDAFPTARASPPVFAFRQILFAFKAAAFVRRNAANYDVIDALIGVLPFSKKRLRFRGLLVARSVGLYLLYERFEQSMARRGPPPPKGKFAGRIFYRVIRRRVLRDSDRAVRRADLINLPNETEAAALRAQIGRAEDIVVFPYGLAPERSRALAQAAFAPAVRLAQQRICFVGMWSPRKGAHDWPGIITAVRARCPEAQFRFLGTMVEPEIVHRALGEVAASKVEVVPTYEPEELPALLADCAVGAFPSYVEGFGLAVLEELAAGLPTVAYDTAGPRDILRDLPGHLLVPAGDVAQFAASICRLLSLEPDEYREICRQSERVAAAFSWPEIARDTIAVYRERLRQFHPS